MTNDIKAIADGLSELLAKATGEGEREQERPLPWVVWTSCSYRRVKTEAGKDVLSGYRCSDGVVDLSMPEDRLVALVAAVNALPALLSHITTLEAENASLREALAYAGDALNNLCVTAASAATCEGDPSGAMQTLHSIADDALGPVRVALSTQGTTDKDSPDGHA